jgi:hypothetical protein
VVVYLEETAGDSTRVGRNRDLGELSKLISCIVFISLLTLHYHFLFQEWRIVGQDK